MSRSEPDADLRVALIYESMFGCTKAIAHAVAAGLEDAGCTVVVRSARSAWNRGLPPFDLLVVGAPTHAFSLSRPSTRHDAVSQGARPEAEPVGLRELLAALSRREHAHARPFAAFDTRVSRVHRLPKAAATRAAHLLVHQGYRPVARPQAFIVEDLRGPLAPGECERARRWGAAIGLAAAGARRPSLRTSESGITRRRARGAASR